MRESRFGGSPSQGAGSFGSPRNGGRRRPPADVQPPRMRCVRLRAHSRRTPPARLGTRSCHPPRARGVVPRLRHDRRSSPRALRRPWSRCHQTGAGDPRLAATAKGAASRLGLHHTWDSLPGDRHRLVLARDTGHFRRSLEDSDALAAHRPPSTARKPGRTSPERQPLHRSTERACAAVGGVADVRAAEDRVRESADGDRPSDAS